MHKLIIFFACLSLFQFAVGLKCYSCDSRKDSKCTDGPDNAVQCGQLLTTRDESFCLKKVSKERNGEQIVERKCVAVGNKDFSKDCRADGLSEIVFCDGCNSDMCNSASPIRFTVVGLISAICVYLFTS